MSTVFEPLPQQHFGRGDFVHAFQEILGDAATDDVEDACLSLTCTDRFLLAHHDDEYYVIHLESATMINWYKHLGRANTCNKPDMTVSDLRNFLSMLKEDLDVSRHA